MSRLIRIGAMLGLALALGGCAYEYLQRTDRVAYSAGDAVRANLESQTTNPTKNSQYETRGLGKNGIVVVPAPDSGVIVP